MPPEDAYAILEAIAEIHGCSDKLKLANPSEAELVAEETAREIVAESKDRAAPFRFSMCNLENGTEIEFYCRGNENTGAICVVVDDRHVEYKGKVYSLSALASELTGKTPVQGPSYFKFNGEWLNDIRERNGF